MAISYKKCVADGVIPDYKCDPCADGEKGRVRGIAYINKQLKEDMTKLHLEDKKWWETQIEAGLIKVIPKTRGTYDGGAPNKVAGFGSVKEKTVSKTHVVTVNDPNHKANDAFYGAIEDVASDYYFAFITDTELRVSSDPLETVEAKDAVEEDTESLVLWQTINTWTQKGRKKIVPIYELGDVIDVFECINDEE